MATSTIPYQNRNDMIFRREAVAAAHYSTLQFTGADRGLIMLFGAISVSQGGRAIYAYNVGSATATPTIALLTPEATLSTKVQVKALENGVIQIINPSATQASAFFVVMSWSNAFTMTYT